MSIQPWIGHLEQGRKLQGRIEPCRHAMAEKYLTMTPINQSDITPRLTEHVTGVSLERLSSETLHNAENLLIDHVGVALLGANQSWCSILRQTVLREGGMPQCSFYGGGTGSERQAALVNGTAGHALELDDTHDESLSHPGCVVIPAALAVAEAEAISGADFLSAIVAGYEAQCRIGSAVAPALVRAGMHPTSQLGAFGALAAAGRAKRLAPDRLEAAFGLAASMTSGIMKFTQDPENTMVKRLHAGLPSERGILACNLASAGFTGPRGAIEGDFGFAKVFANVDNLSRVTEDLGDKFEIDFCSVKFFPCCRMFHALVEAIVSCRQQNGFNANDIEEIKVFGPATMITGHLEYRPQSTMSAQYSLPYVVAVAILDDPATLKAFNTDAIERPDLMAIADKVKAEVDPVIEKAYPKKCGGRVEFTVRGGAVFSAESFDSIGTPARPVSRDQIIDKFRNSTEHIMEKDVQELMMEAILSLRRAENVKSLIRLIRSL